MIQLSKIKRDIEPEPKFIIFTISKKPKMETKQKRYHLEGILAEYASDVIETDEAIRQIEQLYINDSIFSNLPPEAKKFTEFFNTALNELTKAGIITKTQKIDCVSHIIKKSQ